MKSGFSTRLKNVGLGLCVLCGGALALYSCSDQLDDIQTVQGVTSGSSMQLRVAAGAEGAKIWYDGLALSSTAITSSNNSSASSSNSKSSLAPDWSNAITVAPVKNTSRVWLVPALGNNYSTDKHTGYRYLVFAQKNNNKFIGNIIEVYFKNSKSYNENYRMKIVKDFVSQALQKNVKSIDGFEGSAILYDIKYRYVLGYRYQYGKDPLPGERIFITKNNIKKKFQSTIASTSTCDGSGGGGCGPGCEEWHSVYVSEPECHCPESGTTGSGTTGYSGGTTTGGYPTTGSGPYPTPDPTYDPNWAGPPPSTTSKVGPFVMTKDDQRLYPQFTNLMNDLPNFVLSDPKILPAIEFYTHLSRQQILERISPNAGPNIVITGLGAVAQFSNYTPNTIFIDQSEVEFYEANHIASGYAKALSFFLAVSILHEFVHYGDNLTPVEFPGEEGDQFETSVWGVQVDGSNGMYLSNYYK